MTLLEGSDGAAFVDNVDVEEAIDEIFEGDERDVDALDGSSNVYFDGDDGGLDLAQRKALVVLLKNRFISAEKNMTEWRTILATPRAINTRLNDMFLELVIDPRLEVAYKRQVSSGAQVREFPTLLHNDAWQREETALLVFLRVHARQAQARGESSLVSSSEMLDFLRENRPDSATNHARDGERSARAIGALTAAKVLEKVDVGEFRISPAIELLLPEPKLQAIKKWLDERNHATEDPDAGLIEEESE